MKRSLVNTRFLLFRLGQIGKFFKEIPFPYLLILLIMAGLALYFLYAFLDSPANGMLCGGLLVAGAALARLRRKDYHFICLVDEQPWRVFLADYLLFSLPFLLLLLWRGQGLIALGVTAGYAGVALLKQPFRHTSKGFPVPALIPYRAFELRVLVRRRGGSFIVLYLCAFAGLLLPYVSFAFLWFCIIFIFEGFRDCESRAMLNAYERSFKRFLYYKTKLTLGLYCIAAMPVCLIYTAIRPGHWWLAAGFFVLSSLNVILFVISKYALYEPDKKIVSGQIPTGLSAMGIFIPFLAPFTLFLLIRYYGMARRNLTPYLYAYD